VVAGFEGGGAELFSSGWGGGVMGWEYRGFVANLQAGFAE